MKSIMIEGLSLAKVSGKLYGKAKLSLYWVPVSDEYVSEFVLGFTTTHQIKELLWD